MSDLQDVRDSATSWGIGCVVGTIAAIIGIGAAGLLNGGLGGIPGLAIGIYLLIIAAVLGASMGHMDPTGGVPALFGADVGFGFLWALTIGSRASGDVVGDWSRFLLGYVPLLVGGSVTLAYLAKIALDLSSSARQYERSSKRTGHSNRDLRRQVTDSSLPVWVEDHSIWFRTGVVAGVVASIAGVVVAIIELLR